jgi:signal transduction histidine kinase/CheY-like chemotaxis protein
MTSVNSAGVPPALGEPAEVPPPGKALLVLPTAVFLVATVGCACALMLQRMSVGDDEIQVVGASTLAIAFVSLLADYWTWWRWQRVAIAQRASARQLNHFHAVMSQTNRLILRRPRPFELFEGVCELCVKAGHIDLVVVDMSDVGEAHRAAAELPTGGSVPTSPQLLLDGARLQTRLMTLTRYAGKPVIVDDASTDGRLREVRSSCLASGLCSLAAVPLCRGGSLVGILLLCSRTKSFFDGQVTLLLSELGADLSFALDNADRERERHSALLADQSRMAAEDANRAKTEFLSRMSHELRTPLNAMLGFAQLLATDKAQVLSTGQAERVRLITHAGWHLLGLVNDVMDISRIESRRFEVVNVCGDVSSVLDEAVALSQPLARSHEVELSERAASKLGIGAVVDPRRLLQVLLNLLSNACKYNRPNGHVRVEVTQAGAEVFLDVVDNGVGMTKEQLSHMFEPFNRLGNEGHAIEGSGIGLTLTRQLVELMNGRLEIESNPESGTRARVVLPSCAIPLKAPTNEASGSRTPREKQGAAVVLYVEDDPVNRILVEQMLIRCEGVHLLLAENGEDGIALARKRMPDLVLLDMHLPDMTGFDVLTALRIDPRTEALRVVALSANAGEVDVAKALALGVRDYWTKPLELASFLSGISTLLNVRVSSDEAATPAAAGAR